MFCFIIYFACVSTLSLKTARKSVRFRQTVTACGPSVADHMTHMIRKSRSKTIRVLADVYASIEGPAAELLDVFYGRLSRYVHEDPETAPGAGLEDATSRLFADLFAVVYRTVAAAADQTDSASQFDEDYVRCLAGKAPDVRPFGDVPHALAKDISRTFAATSVLVHALR